MRNGLIVSFLSVLLSTNALGVSFAKVEAHCKGSGVTAIVTKLSGETRLNIIEDGSFALGERATKKIIEAGPIVFRTQYSTGPVLEGGVSLRITTKHKNNPEVAGTAFLTALLDGGAVNLLMKCSKY